MNPLVTQQTSPWLLSTRDIDPDRYFGVMVGNGMIGLVSDAMPMKVSSVVLNGVYDRYQRGRVSNILEGFQHVNLNLIVDHQMCDWEHLEEVEQELDLQHAILTTRFLLPGKARITHQMMALRHLPYSTLIQLKVEALSDISITPMSEIEAPSHLRNLKSFYSEIDRPHVKIPLLTSVANSPTGKHQLAACNSFIFEEAHGEEPLLIHEDWDENRHLLKFSKQVPAGQTYEFAVVGSTCSSAHYADAHNEAERLTVFAKLEGTERLRKRHIEAWKELWQSDIEIEGDPRVQQEVRLLLYYLYSCAREGTALSLSPVGLSGLGYNGHIFWDTELWMYPPLLMLQPEIAKSLLDYRFERMEAARQNAFAHGYRGVMFPWESAEDGSEQTPVWALTGPFQHHITGCIAWAFWKYYQRTQDKVWLKEKGYPLLKEAATFWCDRVERNGPGRYDINNVIGANEWEENIDNNAFTNAVAITALRAAISAAKVLGETPDPDWQEVADNIPILQFPDGTTRENATYDGVEIKQADVNLLAYPLEFYTDEAQIQKDLAYYAPRMSPEGPAMGVATLATIAARLGDTEEGYEHFLNSYRPNGLPPFGVMAECAGGKGVSPFFITGAGGSLQVLLTGFAGLHLTDDGITQMEPKLPAKWRSLRVKIKGEYQ